MVRRTAIGRGELGVDVAVYSIAALALIVTVYPLLFVFFQSISSPRSVLLGELRLFPDTVYLGSYAKILQKRELWRYYYNTLWIVAVGTLINLVMTMLTGYVLSKKDFKFRNHIMAFIVFTMFFGGGMIPFFIQVRNLGLVNTRWALVLPFAVSAWNVIIARTYFQSTIPESLYESAIIDGATKLQILVYIVLPLSKAVMAVVALWCIVGFWNSYFWALIFLPDPAKQPIQIFLVKVLVEGRAIDLGNLYFGFDSLEKMGIAEQIKYVVIIITILPMLLLYPFLQKYFIKGIMLGALKG